MRWFKPNIRSSIHAIFSAVRPKAPVATEIAEVDIEDIRDLMLGMLEGLEGLDGTRVTTLMRRINYASEVAALWFLRGDLMFMLASVHGETAAREMIASVSAMFEDLLPPGLRSRPSPLGVTD
ncbi:MAG TPA: hypothetical protein VK996_04600 [Ramlibacter sp.]|nr:hypothetical protein [Ramlibacter sp.]